MAGITLDRNGWYSTDWSMFHEEKHWGYLRVTLTSQEALIEFVSSTPGSEGDIIDSVNISHAN